MLRCVEPLFVATLMLSSCAHCEPHQSESGEQAMKPSTQFYPKNALKCVKDDYLIRGDGERWSVFMVEDVVLVSRLVPLSFPQGVELMEETNILDSVVPSVKLLVSAYPRTFASRDVAVDAITHGGLGDTIPHLCLDFTAFPPESSTVFKRKAP
jgi:hypothetical protein